MEGNLKVGIVALAAWLFWSSVIVQSSRIGPTSLISHNILEATDFTFYADDPTPASYSHFLTFLRRTLTCYDIPKQYNLPVLCAYSDFVASNYSLVDLSYDSTRITLALDVVNLKLVAYKSGTDSYFFKNTYDLKDQLFSKTNPSRMPYENSYESIGNRAEVDYGMPALRNAIENLSKYKELSPSLINVMGMVSEATRFKVIENAVKKDVSVNFVPNQEMISYEDKWEILSKSIQQAKANGEFRKPVELKNEKGETVIVSNVGQVQQNIGILENFLHQEGIKDQFSVI